MLPYDEDDSFNSSESLLGVRLMEAVPYEGAQHVSTSREGHAVQQDGHRHRADMRLRRIANIP